MSNHSEILKQATSDHKIRSIETSYVACNLTFAMPQQTKKDRRAQHDAEEANNAHGAILARRRLWSKATMAPFNSIAAACRAYVAGLTTMVGETRMLHKELIAPTMQVVEHEFFLQWDQQVIKFGQDYTAILREAEQQQGRLFDASVYSDVTSITSQFRRSFDIYGVGNVDTAIFTGMESDIAEDVAKAVHDTTMRNMGTALQEPMTRLIDAVMNIHNKTSRDNSRIHENLMGELEELTAVMPALNVLGLPYLNDMAAKCRQDLLAPTEEIQNKDSGARVAVAENSAEILEAMGIDADSNQQITEAAERKQVAKRRAAEILAQMKDFL